ncbi:hypothetical protein [Pseudoduganella albidiflava]|uniref:Uncharacterized protein n=1 Tax=Pseudoduganella albidiflava TaxID=321983 RepID=A0ABX5RTU9_9BURK|nr:hypothetical protein [Pseudoduganella albidiflava]QBI02024.1 hypothetical protein EYF70_15055 [Pseudoduganella albidiflava]
MQAIRRTTMLGSKLDNDLDTFPEVVDFAMKTISWKPFSVLLRKVCNRRAERKSLLLQGFLQIPDQFLFVRAIDQLP